MSRLLRPTAAVLAAFLGLAPVPARGGGKLPGVPGLVLLDGQATEVRWTDGDSFKVESGPLRGLGTRVVGYNALEAFGPVHRTAGMGPAELEAIAVSSAPLLARTTWRCSVAGKPDGYGRPLVSCPEAAATLVRAGHAVVYAVGARPDPALLALQREAQAARRGLWAGGVPPELITSLHSAGERDLKGKAPYDRLVDTRTGETRRLRHQSSYLACQEVCVGAGATISCMVYVPFERRYRDRPACLGPNRDR
jgi:micrococcal nuclease